MDKRERLAFVIDRCLANEAAYKMFDMLAAAARLGMEDRLAYVELVRESGLYTDEEIRAIERLIVSGAAGYFKDMVDMVREERVRREIEELTM